MFDLTILDYVYVGVVLGSTVWATIRGGVYETVATLSWIVAAITARFTSPMLDDLLQKLFKLSDSTVGTLVASYFIVFFVVLLIFGFINQKLRDKIQDSMMNVTDHTLGVIFGIIRGVAVMGIVYWCALWYYSDAPHRTPEWLTNARTRPIMQVTAVKLDQWFLPGSENKLLERDVAATHEAAAIFDNLVNPRVSDEAKQESGDNDKSETPPTPKTEETGYKQSERTAMENQLLQIDAARRASEQREAAQNAE